MHVHNFTTPATDALGQALKHNLVMKLMMTFGLEYINAAIKISLAACVAFFSVAESWPWESQITDEQRSFF